MGLPAASRLSFAQRFDWLAVPCLAEHVAGGIALALDDLQEARKFRFDRDQPLIWHAFVILTLAVADVPYKPFTADQPAAQTAGHVRVYTRHKLTCWCLGGALTAIHSSGSNNQPVMPCGVLLETDTGTCVEPHEDARVDQ